jgi:hypothetical protein
LVLKICFKKTLKNFGGGIPKIGKIVLKNLKKNFFEKLIFKKIFIY